MSTVQVVDGTTIYDDINNINEAPPVATNVTPEEIKPTMTGSVHTATVVNTVPVIESSVVHDDQQVTASIISF